MSALVNFLTILDNYTLKQTSKKHENSIEYSKTPGLEDSNNGGREEACQRKDRRTCSTASSSLCFIQTEIDWSATIPCLSISSSVHWQPALSIHSQPPSIRNLFRPFAASSVYSQPPLSICSLLHSFVPRSVQPTPSISSLLSSISSLLYLSVACSVHCNIR